MVAAVDGISGKVGVVKLVGLKLDQLDPDRSRRAAGPPHVPRPEGSAISRPPPGRFRPRASRPTSAKQQRAVHPSGKRDDHPPEAGQYLPGVRDLFSELVGKPRILGARSGAFVVLSFIVSVARFHVGPTRRPSSCRSAPRQCGRRSLPLFPFPELLHLRRQVAAGAGAELSDHLGGAAHGKGIIRDILGHERSRPDDAPHPDRHPGQSPSSGSRSRFRSGPGSA